MALHLLIELLDVSSGLEGRKEGTHLILFMAIWLWTYGKGPFK